MKKIFLILIVLCAFAASSQAQDRIESRRVVLGAPRPSNRTVVVVGKQPGYYHTYPRYRQRWTWRERRRAEWRRQHYYHRHGWH